MSGSSTGHTEIGFGTVSPTTTDHVDNDSFIVTDDGTATGNPIEFWKFDGDTSTWVRVPSGSGTTCPAPMTRTALLGLAGSYDPNCHYIVTDYNRGTVGAASIEMHAVDADTLSMDVHVLTTHDNMAWDGRYDITTNRLIYLADNLDNDVVGQGTVDAFPWGNTSVADNRLNNATLNYTAGTMNGNRIENAAVVTVNGRTFNHNNIEAEANVTYSGTGTFARNTIAHESNVTVSSGDFRENTVAGDATVVSSTSGDVDNCEFNHLSNSTISGTANVDTCTVGTDGNLIAENATVTSVEVKQEGNLTIRGGSLLDSTIEQDAQVVLYGGTHYENRWGTSVVFNQVSGTSAYVRYSSFDGTTTWTHGGVNISNVESYVTTVNTTGSSGLIANTHLHRAYLTAVRNIPTLTIQDCSITGYSSVSATGATLLYMYRTDLSAYGRVLASAGTTLRSSYNTISNNGYIRATRGELIANYNEVSANSYILNSSSGANRAERNTVAGQSNIRFLATSTGCRIYCSSCFSGCTMYVNGSTTNSYLYYCNGSSAGQMYTNNTVNSRIYYCSVSSRGRLYDNASTGTHYVYYCESTSNSLIEMRTCVRSRMYSVHASSQSILRLQNGTTASRLYYSSVAAYYYLYLTLTGTRYGLHGHGRLTRTVTNPANGTGVENF